MISFPILSTSRKWSATIGKAMLLKCVIAQIYVYTPYARIGDPDRRSPRKPAEILDYSLLLPESARPPVIVPQAVAIKLLTPTGPP